MNTAEPSECSSSFKPVGNGVGEGVCVGVAVAVELGVRVGLGVNVLVAVAVGVMNRPGIPEVPEHERTSSASTTMKIINFERAFCCFIFSPERSALL
jgi:hypothetical protein